MIIDSSVEQTLLNHISFTPIMNSDDEEGGETERSRDTVTITKEEVKEPPMYKVVMLNDDYTSMEFVVHILKRFFRKDHTEAESIMLKIHNDGKAICGIFTFEVAETKVLKVNRYSREKEHPLKCVCEPCD